MLDRLDSHLKGLSPSYFALVMATGIVSIAAHLLDVAPIADALLVINVCAYVVIWALTIVRLVRHPREVFRDLISHQRGPGFLTVVAGTCVLATQLILIEQLYAIATVLLAL